MPEHFEGSDHQPELVKAPEQNVMDEATLARRREVYRDTAYEDIHKAQRERGEPVTDIYADYDGTLRIPGKEKELRDFMDAAEAEQYPVVVVTGNDLPAMEKNMAAAEQKEFPVMIASVGTEIFILQRDGTYMRDEEYRKMLLEEKHYNRREIAQAGAELIQEFAEHTPNVELNYQGIPESPYKHGERAYLEDPEANADKVQEFKLSFHFFAESPEEVEQIGEAARVKFAGQEVVVCEELNYNRQHVGEARLKYCLDVVPITKAGAVNYLAKLMQVERRVVAGDSGNDTAMMLQAEGAFGVVVGGAKPELLRDAGAAVAPKPGKRSFRQVQPAPGQAEAQPGRSIYFEQDPDRKGAPSLERALRILQKLGKRIEVRKRAG